MKQYPIAREGWIFVVLLLGLTLLVYQFCRGLVFLPALLMVFTAYFFRNPSRNTPDLDGIIVSPADGVILRIEKTYENQFLNQDTIKVSIFLNIFNVHINRIPVEGMVESVERTSGRFVPACRKDASELNAKNCLVLNTRWGKIVVVQITGLIARRIVCWANEGDFFSTGQRFGLIRFGSCTEVFLPSHVSLTIAPGDKVRGGETIIGRFVE